MRLPCSCILSFLSVSAPFRNASLFPLSRCSLRTAYCLPLPPLFLLQLLPLFYFFFDGLSLLLSTSLQSPPSPPFSPLPPVNVHALCQKGSIQCRHGGDSVRESWHFPLATVHVCIHSSCVLRVWWVPREMVSVDGVQCLSPSLVFTPSARRVLFFPFW